jgi:hypothetical protein
MDVDFMLTDTFELIRPGMTLFKSFDDAGRAVDELMATQALQPTGASSRCRELKTMTQLLTCWTVVHSARGQRRVVRRQRRRRRR